MALLLAIDLALPGRVWPATLLSNVRHLVAPLFLALLVVAVARRRRLRALACAGGLALGAATVGTWFLPPDDAPPAPAQDGAADVTLHVVTANLGGGRSDGVVAARVLAGLDADLVLLQEVSPHHRRAMERPLRDAFPHQRWRPLGLSGKAALSRHPIVEEDLAAFPARVTIQSLRLEVGPRRRPVLVRNVKLSATAAWTGRDGAGFDALERFAASTPEDEALRIVAGDLNTSPWGGVVRRLEALGLRSAFSAAGRGAGHTFPVAGRYRGLPVPPAVRIDYVLVGTGMLPVAAEVGPDLGGDHLPMVATIRTGR